MSEALWRWSACEMAEGIRRRDVSCVEVVRSAGSGLDNYFFVILTIACQPTSGMAMFANICHQVMRGHSPWRH